LKKLLETVVAEHPASGRPTANAFTIFSHDQGPKPDIRVQHKSYMKCFGMPRRDA
jgi:hypothetical protein